MRLRHVLPAVLAQVVVCGVNLRAAPLPIGLSDVTIRYETNGGEVSFSGQRDFNGTFPSDATNLGAAPNVRAFNSVNSFGRRPLVPGTVRENEALISHAFFKIDNGGDYFPGLVDNGTITIEVNNMTFSEPAAIDPATLMVHAKWLPEQSDTLDDIYIHVDDHHTITDPFRDFDAFEGVVFFNNPVPNFVLGNDAILWTITGNGTTDLSLSVSFPYELLRNLEEDGQTVAPELPAPQGFLEPFHFHVEYVVTPQPTTLLLFAPALWAVSRRRR